MEYARWEGVRKLRKQLRQWWFPLAWVQVAGSCLTLTAPPTSSFGQLPTQCSCEVGRERRGRVPLEERYPFCQPLSR